MTELNAYFDQFLRGPWVLYVPNPSQDQMNMAMKDCLLCSFAGVDADVESGDHRMLRPE